MLQAPPRFVSHEPRPVLRSPPARLPESWNSGAGKFYRSFQQRLLQRALHQRNSSNLRKVPGQRTNYKRGVTEQ